MMAGFSTATAVLVLGAATLGCVHPVLGPPPARAMSSRNVPVVYFEEVSDTKAAPRCRHPVPFVSADATPLHAYRVLSRTSATCAPLAPHDCDDTLQARACALGADAVVLDDHADTNGQRRTLSVTMVRWTP
jgi:hypothetical protein